MSVRRCGAARYGRILGGLCSGVAAMLVVAPLALAQTFGSRLVLNSTAPGTSDDSQQTVAGDGNGNWITVFRSTAPLVDLETDGDILYQVSTDDGTSWSDAASLASYQATDAENDWKPQIVSDHAGAWLVVWTSGHDLSGAVGTDDDLFVSRSLDAGQSWSVPTPLNSNATTDGPALAEDINPSLVTDRKGTWLAMWNSFESLGGTLSGGRDAFFSRSTDNGATWSSMAALNTDATTDTRQDLEPKAAPDGNGNWVAVWEVSEFGAGPTGSDQDIFSAYSSDDGLTWSAPIHVNDATTDSGVDADSEIATDGAGNWVIVWTTFEDIGGTIGTDRDIAFARSADGGATWSTPAALLPEAATDGGADDFAPEILFDGADSLVVYFTSTNDLSGTLGGTYHVLTTRSTDGGQTWSPVSAISPDAATVTTGLSSRSATDLAGNWVVTAVTNDDIGGTIGTDTDMLYFAGYGPDGDGDGLADAAEVKLGTDRFDEDTDDDGVCDGSNQVGACTSPGADNCPFVINGPQTNSDSLVAGDACQCGNVDGLVGLDAVDLLRVREHVVGRTLSGPFDVDFCDVDGNAACDLVDVKIISRLASGASTPAFVQQCAAYGAP